MDETIHICRIITYKFACVDYTTSIYVRGLNQTYLHAWSKVNEKGSERKEGVVAVAHGDRGERD